MSPLRRVLARLTGPAETDPRSEAYCHRCHTLGPVDGKHCWNCGHLLPGMTLTSREARMERILDRLFGWLR